MDPSDTRETPWIDIARQLAGDVGVATLGSARTTPPGTEAIGRVIEKAGGSVLILFDEVLNFLNRHRGLAEGFYAFVQNLTVAMTGARGSACVISLPRSQVEMSESDLVWQERITKVVKRVAKDLLVNDEAEIGEVVRRRLFDDLGKESIRRAAALTYANWCFDHRAELLPEVTAVDRAVTGGERSGLPASALRAVLSIPSVYPYRLSAQVVRCHSFNIVTTSESRSWLRRMNAASAWPSCPAWVR